jgi:2-keto-4-pentenoate hydratase/2-oxohepta-3-ene-1,7-dioic acid hydratase in catechol pathway
MKLICHGQPGKQKPLNKGDALRLGIEGLGEQTQPVIA